MRRALLLVGLTAAVLACGHASDVAASELRGSGPTVMPQADSLGDTDGAKENAESFTFQAEVNRLMDIIINSLYSNRDIFLRELVSNASDALDKIRFLSLTKTSPDTDASTESTEEEKLEIRVSADKDEGTLTISDSGIGMSREDLIQNLGTIARSGTSSFLDKLGEAAKETAQKNDKNSAGNLIGQFGVGFYSAYLVADKVRVESRVQGGDVNVWESGADESFVVYSGKTAGFEASGTRITLFLKEDAREYAEQDKLKELIQRYSQFINFPIYLRTKEEVEVPVEDEDSTDESSEDGDTPKEEGADDESTDNADDDDIKVTDGDDDEKADSDEKKPKTRLETRLSWKLVNENKPVWTRDSSEVSDGEYQKFYDGISKMPGKPLARTHFRGEGEVEFRSILYVPDKAPVGLFGGQVEYEKDAIRLYVRRVLVTDKFEEGLLPRYLAFLIGIVDSDDLPINVSREMLQKSKTLDIIKRKLIRKALEMIRGIAKDEDAALEAAKNSSKKDEDSEKSDTESKDDADDSKDEEKDDSEKKPERPYLKFWKEFGKGIKLGVMEDESNRARLAKLLRYRSSKCNPDDPDDWTSLEQYVERMKEDQNYIYYHSGESEEAIRTSPYLEKLLAKDYEVLFLSEPLDEHMIMNLPDYEGSKFMSVAKDDFKFGDKDQKEEKEKADTYKKMYKPLTKFLKSKLSAKVSKVKLSTKLSDTPCVLSSEQFGYSPRMEVIMKAQAFANPDSYQYMMPKTKIMELNPHHPVVKKMLELIKEAKEAESETATKLEDKVEQLGHLVYDTALISSGYLMQEPRDFATRMYKWIGATAGVDASAVVKEEEPDESGTDDDDDGVFELDSDDLDAFKIDPSSAKMGGAEEVGEASDADDTDAKADADDADAKAGEDDGAHDEL